MLYCNYKLSKALKHLKTLLLFRVRHLKLSQQKENISKLIIICFLILQFFFCSSSESKKWDRQAHVIVFMLNAILMMNRAKNVVEGSKKNPFFTQQSLLFSNTQTIDWNIKKNRKKYRIKKEKKRKEKKKKRIEMKRIVNGMSWI